MATSRTGALPFSFSVGKIFKCRNVFQNWHFANSKPEALPEGRIRFLRLRNVPKFSLPERVPGRLAPKRRKIVITQTGIRPFHWWRRNAFSSSETSKNFHFPKGKPAVSLVAIKRFFKLGNIGIFNFADGKPVVYWWRSETFSKTEKSENVHFCERQNGHFDGAEGTLFQDPKLRKMFILRTANRPFRWWRWEAFASSETSENGHFDNGKPDVTLMEMKNVFLAPKLRNMVISRTGSRSFRWWKEDSFSSSETSENVHFANGKLAVSLVEMKRVLQAPNRRKMDI